MMSAYGESPWTKPVVHGSVAGRSFQPAGYETEIPCMTEVYVSVSASGSEGDGLGDTLGEAAGEGDGVGKVPPPTPGPDPGRRTASPSAPRAITTTAATASSARLFMS